MLPQRSRQRLAAGGTPPARRRPAAGCFPALPGRPSTCRRSSTRCWPAGGTARSSSARSSRPRAARCGRSTRARRPPTACRARTTSRRGSSRTSSPASRRCRATTCPRRAGWDCHGLPVELAVEKELGFSGKQDIEAYGIAEFNARCRESVLRHVDAFEELTERMGYWVDLSRAYWTMDAELHRVGLVVAQGDLRQGPAGPGLPGQPVLPALRHAAVRPRARPARVYQTSPTRRSRAVPADRPARRRDPELAGADLLVWTTTPWTLVSNTAVAVHPEVTYVVARTPATAERRGRRRAADAAACSARAGEVVARVPGPRWPVPPTGGRST